MRAVREKYVFVLAIIFVTASICSATDVYLNGSFENWENTSGGLPSSYSNWNGDYSEIVSATAGINPMDGSNMLQFKGTGADGAAGAVESLVWKLVDMSSFAELIQTGQAVANASAYFNRVVGNEQTDTMFGIVLYAHNGNCDTFPFQFSNGIFLDRISYNFETDSDIVTWESGSVALHLPVNTTFIAVGVRAQENIYNNSSYPEFDGHFADGVSLEIIPEPCTVMLLGLGGLGLLRQRRR